MTKRDQENPVMHLVEEMVEVAAANQAAGLKVLQAEIEALSHLMPGTGHKKTEAERNAEDLKIEADFDNMPV